MSFSVYACFNETYTEVIIPCNYKIFTFPSLFPLHITFDVGRQSPVTVVLHMSRVKLRRINGLVG